MTTMMNGNANSTSTHFDSSPPTRTNDEKVDSVETGMVSSSEKRSENKEVNPPNAVKLLILVTVVLFCAGGAYSGQTLYVLKGSFKEALDINNTQYGIAQSAVFLMGTFMPMVGGILMDRFGPLPVAVASTCSVALANLCIAIASETRLFALMTVGRILHGMGSGVTLVAQKTILARWFRGTALSLAFGVFIATSNLSGFVAQVVAIPLKEAAGRYNVVVWVAFGVCLLSCLATATYAVILYSLGTKDISAQQKRSFSLRNILRFPAGYWFVPLTMVFFGASWNPLLGSLTELVQQRYSPSESQASLIASVSLVVPVIISPMVGGWMDRYGHRMTLLVLCGGFLMIALLLLLLTKGAIVIFALLLFSISMAVVPVALGSTISLALPQEYVGSGTGIDKAVFSTGTVISNLLIGYLQDADGGRYDHALLMLFVVAILAFISCVLYWLYDRVYNHRIMEVSTKARKLILETLKASESSDETKKPRSPRLLSIISVTLILSLMATSWAWFIAANVTVK
ncbi:uncharacterized protein VTP21DRAFT_8741 [Calcarisporiella thermophila]|uniref:uncharacterized protein n=1 Tax=Calcarisporiella thermophila TaxID=911321 RepID=UPI003743DA59